MRKGIVELSGSVTKTVDSPLELCIGGNLNTTGSIINAAAVDFSHAYIGENLTDTQ